MDTKFLSPSFVGPDPYFIYFSVKLQHDPSTLHSRSLQMSLFTQIFTQRQSQETTVQIPGHFNLFAAASRLVECKNQAVHF